MSPYQISILFIVNMFNSKWTSLIITHIPGFAFYLILLLEIHSHKKQIENSICIYTDLIVDIS